MLQHQAIFNLDLLIPLPFALPPLVVIIRAAIIILLFNFILKELAHFLPPLLILVALALPIIRVIPALKPSVNHPELIILSFIVQLAQLG